MPATNQAPEVPDWIYPGAKVLLLVDDYGQRGYPIFYRANVVKLAKLSFTVTFGKDGEREERINLRDLCSKSRGSTAWSHWSYRVIRPESVEAQRLREIRDRVRSRDRMVDALKPLISVNAREKRDDLELIREAVAALTRHGDLVQQQNTANPVHRFGEAGLTRCGKQCDDHPHYVSRIDESVTCADCKESES